ncbi:FG-GAP-like repeat-containing protein [bacterium]|nr:FG-GAP-like repeat-containing protein [bacterium]
MKRLFVFLAIPSLAIGVFATCGGGGGGGESITPSIPYSGINTPAFITSENAVTLASGTYFGMTFADQPGDIIFLSAETQPDKVVDQPQINTLLLARTWEKAATTYFELHPTGRVTPLAQINERMDGLCDGYADMDGSVDESTGDFSVNVTYQGYTDDCVFYMSGRTNIRGNIDPYDLTFTRMTTTYEALVLTIGGTTITQSGTWFMDYSQYPYRETINIVTRDDSTGKTYWMHDYEVYTSNVTGTSDQELQIIGRYYDPDIGYVDITTEQALRFRSDESYPYEGVLSLLGENNTGAQFNAISNAAYHVLCDEDGDDDYDDFDSGVVHWPGENNLPVAVVDDPGTAGLYCTVTLDGSGSYDIDTDPIASYFWTVVSIPDGSQAVLSDPNSISPTFTPDVEGEYQFRLIVSDGIGENVTWGTGCGVINDDLACVSVSGFFECVYDGMRVIDVGSDPEAVAIGDVNGDGRNDVVLTTDAYADPENDYKLFVFPQDEAGQLGTPVKYSTAYATSGFYQSVAVGNLNLDSRMDVVVGSGEGVGIFYQNDSGGLDSMVTVSTAPCSLVRVGDVNDDNRMDIVCLNGFGSSITVIPQTGTGALGTPAQYPVDLGGYNDLELGDVDGDGLTDVVAMSGQGFGDNIGILLQNDSGTLDPPVYYDLGGDETTNSVGVGDVNGDGLDDVVVTLSGDLRVFYQNDDSPHTLDTAVSVGTYGHGGPVEVSDIDADGDKDIISIQTAWQNIEIVRQGTGGSLGSYELYLGPFFNGANPHGLAVGDIDGNGINDVVTAETMYGLVVLYDSVFN